MVHQILGRGLCIDEEPSINRYTSSILPSTRRLEEFSQHQRAAGRQMRVPLCRQHGVERFRGPSDEVDALGLEQRAAVLLGQRQRRGRGADVDAASELGLADRLEPVEPVPVSRRQKVLGHRHFRRRLVVIELWWRHVGVDERSEAWPRTPRGPRPGPPRPARSAPPCRRRTRP